MGGVATPPPNRWTTPCPKPQHFICLAHHDVHKTLVHIVDKRVSVICEKIRAVPVYPKTNTTYSTRVAIDLKRLQGILLEAFTEPGCVSRGHHNVEVWFILVEHKRVDKRRPWDKFGRL